jgi:hypothetical protein
MELKSFLSESFLKEYYYRVKIAHDCGDAQMEQLERCLSKYNPESIAPWNVRPLEENPIEFTRSKHVEFISEVSSTDIVLKYPCQPRVLEVWIATNMGLPHERVICYDIKEPRRLEADIAADRHENDVERYADAEDSEMSTYDQEHYKVQNASWANDPDVKYTWYGETYNKKFLETLQAIKAEKGADYFRHYPSKDEIMGDALKPTWDELNMGVNMGKGVENGKQVDTISQSASRASSTMKAGSP